MPVESVVVCGRYTVGRPGKVISKLLNREISGTVDLPTYNASPGQHLPVILDTHAHLIVPAFWGMPRPSGGRAGRGLVINARSETVHQRPMFRDSVRQRRCLVIADGFYEWQEAEGGKQPFRITLNSGGLFMFAGIWQEAQGETCYVILTTAPNRVTQPIHDRMPVILEEREQERWLDHGLGLEETLRLLDPFPDDEMTAYPVSRAVNSSRNNGPELIETLEPKRSYE